MQDLKFPIKFVFKISTLANDFTATDASGNMVAYVRQKMFKLKEDIVIFSDETKSKTLYTIKADRWLDFSAAYSFRDANGKEFGKVVRKGWRSLWKAEYQIIDEHSKFQYKIGEDSATVRVLDAILGQIPLLGIFTGYFFNPSYSVTDKNDKPVVKLKKEASFFGRKFKVDKTGTIDNDDDDRIMLGLMMMILLERRRG